MKVSVLLPRPKLKSSTFSSLLTAGADIIFQTGVFVMKVRSTWSKASQGMGVVWQRAENTQHSAEQDGKTKSFFHYFPVACKLHAVLRVFTISTGFLSEAVFSLTVCFFDDKVVAWRLSIACGAAVPPIVCCSETCNLPEPQHHHPDSFLRLKRNDRKLPTEHRSV